MADEVDLEKKYKDALLHIYNYIIEPPEVTCEEKLQYILDHVMNTLNIDS